MVSFSIHAIRASVSASFIAVASAVIVPHMAVAQSDAVSSGETRTIKGERYVPTIWVDPDGCEHWVMDDGIEGYMSPHVTRDGRPVCHRGKVCGVMNTDQFFATDRYAISAAGQQRLREFFTSATAESFIIVGHTDSRASDSYNMRLSQNRAHAVAKVARSAGVRVAEIRGYGERQPKASNATTEGRAQNRRVEILCLRYKGG